MGITGECMKISVLMSVYAKDNHEHLKKAIDSVGLNQTLKPSQIVIVKDGPVSAKISKTIDDCRKTVPDINFTIVEKEHNQGLAAALNSGLMVCENEWIARMDADDISVNERFVKQVEYISVHPETSVLGTCIAEFEEDENLLIRKRVVPVEYLDICKMAKTRNPINHMSVMMKKDAVVKAGGYSENFGTLEDYKLWLDLILRGHKFHNLSECLVKVRIGNGFISRRSDKRSIDDWSKIQEYMVLHKFIGKKKAALNNITMRIFTHLPMEMKNIAYNYFLRKQ
jgi:glycosyltransferase involved in cell wall biosynthesis